MTTHDVTSCEKRMNITSDYKCYDSLSIFCFGGAIACAGGKGDQGCTPLAGSVLFLTISPLAGSVLVPFEEKEKLSLREIDEERESEERRVAVFSRSNASITVRSQVPGSPTAHCVRWEKPRRRPK